MRNPALGIDYHMGDRVATVFWRTYPGLATRELQAEQQILVPDRHAVLSFVSHARQRGLRLLLWAAADTSGMSGELLKAVKHQVCVSAIFNAMWLSWALPRVIQELQ